MLTHSSISEKPFFVVGHPRSGTTLLRFILSSHSRLYVPEETGFIPFLNLPPEQHLTKQQVHQLINQIGKLNYLWGDLVADPGKFFESLQPPTLPVLIDALFHIMIRPFNAQRWGDKTPLYVRYILRLNQLFPDAQFIHMIRDGRDAALSARKKWGSTNPYQDEYYLLANWVRNIAAGRAAGRWLGPDRYLEVRYESLVQNPEYEIRRICGFLNEEFESVMLNHTSLARAIGPGPDGHTEILRPINSESVRVWKTKMSPYHQKLADALAGHLLAELGYEPANLPPMNLSEQAKTMFLSARFVSLDFLRNVLYQTGVLTLNRTMRKAPAQSE